MVFTNDVHKTQMVCKDGDQSAMKQTEAAKPRGEETYLCQDMKNGVQSVAQDMSCVAFGWTGIVQRLNGIVQIFHTNLSHHGNQDIPGIIPAHQPRTSSLK